MNAKQRSTLNLLVLLNIVVYSVFGFYAFVVKPAQDRVSSPTIAAAAEPVEPLVAPTPIPLVSMVVATPTDLPAPSLTPAPTSSPVPTVSPLPTNTPLPWQEGGSWWLPSNSSAAAVALAPSPTSAPTNTPLPWQEGGSWWQAAAPPSPTAVATRVAPTAVAGLAPSPSAKSASQQIAIAAPSPTGDSPSSPMLPADTWNILGSGSTVWYRVGRGGEHIDVFVDATPMLGMAMQVFAPSNMDRPIGQGSFEKGRLVWSGGQVNSMGDWLARVSNNSPASVQYRLTSASRDITPCVTHSYWEFIGPNRVWWTACQ